MKVRLANTALERLTNGAPDEAPLSEDEVLLVLARIARTGKPGDRLRAAELIGKQLGMFREALPGGGMTLERMVLAADGRVRQPVTIQLVDPYAEKPQEDTERPDEHDAAPCRSSQ